MESATLLIVILIVSILVAFAFMALAIYIRIKRAIEAGLIDAKDDTFLKRFKKTMTASFAAKEGEGIYEGSRYRFRRELGGKNNPPAFFVMVDSFSEGDFEIKKENAFDRFFKRVGITAEVQTGDPTFDNDFFIHTDTPEFAAAFFRDGRKAEAVRYINKAGFNLIKYDGKTMQAAWKPYRLPEPPDDAQIKETAGYLVTLASYLPAVRHTKMYGIPAWKLKRIFVFAPVVAAYLLGMLFLVFGMVEYKPLDMWKFFFDSLNYSVPAFAAFAVFSVVMLKGRSGSHKELLVAVLLLLFAIPFAGIGSGIFFNGYLDESDPVRHAALVTHKYISSTKNGKNYHAVVESWRADSETEKIRVSFSEYRRITPQQTKIAVTSKAGRFGFEWIKEYNVEEF